MTAQPRVNDMAVGVEAPRPYSAAGNLPADAVVSVYGVHGNEGARRYVSDAPYVPPSYNERPECNGTRSNGQPCHAKAEIGHAFCGSHLDQE